MASLTTPLPYVRVAWRPEQHNRITNGTFETNTSGWATTTGVNTVAGTSITRITTDSHSGSASASVVTAATIDSGVHWDFGSDSFFSEATYGAIYVATVWLKRASGGRVIRLTLGSEGTTSDRAQLIITDLADSWTPYTIRWLPTGTRTDVQLALSTGTDQSVTVRVDDAQVYLFDTFSQVENGTFGTDTTGWSATGTGASISRVTTSPFAGSGNGRIVTGTDLFGGADFSFGTRTFVSGRTYRLQLGARAFSGSSDVSVGLGDVGAGDRTSPTKTLTSSWAIYTVDWTPSADRTAVTVTLRNTAAASNTFDIDAVEVFEAIDNLGTDVEYLSWANVPETVSPITIRVVNSTGKYDARNASGSLYGLLKPGRRVLGRAVMTRDCMGQRNGTFEAGVEGWTGYLSGTIARSTAESHGGAASARITSSGTTLSGAYLDLGIETFVDGHTYQVTVYAKTISGAGDWVIEWYDEDSTEDFTQSFTPTGSFVAYTLFFTPAANRSSAQLYILHDAASVAVLSIDDVTITDLGRMYPLFHGTLRTIEGSKWEGTADLIGEDSTADLVRGPFSADFSAVRSYADARAIAVAAVVSADPDIGASTVGDSRLNLTTGGIEADTFFDGTDGEDSAAGYLSELDDATQSVGWCVPQTSALTGYRYTTVDRATLTDTSSDWAVDEDFEDLTGVRVSDEGLETRQVIPWQSYTELPSPVVDFDTGFDVLAWAFDPGRYDTTDDDAPYLHYADEEFGTDDNHPEPRFRYPRGWTAKRWLKRRRKGHKVPRRTRIYPEAFVPFDMSAGQTKDVVVDFTVAVTGLTYQLLDSGIYIIELEKRPTRYVLRIVCFSDTTVTGIFIEGFAYLQGDDQDETTDAYDAQATLGVYPGPTLSTPYIAAAGQAQGIGKYRNWRYSTPRLRPTLVDHNNFPRTVMAGPTDHFTVSADRWSIDTLLFVSTGCRWEVTNKGMEWRSWHDLEELPTHTDWFVLGSSTLGAGGDVLAA